MNPCIDWLDLVRERTATVTIDISVFPVDVVARAAFRLTDRAYIALDTRAPTGSIHVHITQKDESIDLIQLGGEFHNDLLLDLLRAQIANETQTIRDLIYAQAFAEADIPSA